MGTRGPVRLPGRAPGAALEPQSGSDNLWQSLAQGLYYNFVALMHEVGVYELAIKREVNRGVTRRCAVRRLV